MKKYFLVFIALPLFVFSQEENTTIHKNNISVNPFSILFGTIQLDYERAITRNMSFDLEVGAKISGGLVKIDGFDSPTIQTNDFQFKGVIITPSFRWYLQKTSIDYTGLYVGAYYRYRNNNDKITGTYTSQSGSSSPIDLEVDVITNSLGVMVGYKLPLGKHFNMDFIIGGPGYNFGKIKVKENQALPESFYEDVEELIDEDLSFIRPYIGKIDFHDNGNFNQEASVKLPMLRYAIKIGYSF